MTTREKAIVSAWTTELIGSMEEMLKYVSEKMGRTMSEHELKNYMSYGEFRQKYNAVILPDWLSLCEGDAESTDKSSWWR